MRKLATHLESQGKASGLPAEIIAILKKQNEYKENAAKWRGLVLNYCIDVEIQLNNFLSFYFCRTNELKWKEILTLVFENEMSFYKKIDLSMKLLKDKKAIMNMNINTVKNT